MKSNLIIASLAVSFFLIVTPAKADGNSTCTPVYGMANSCAEHKVVDTDIDTGIFYNLAGFSYLTGLLSFIKAKKA